MDGTSAASKRRGLTRNSNETRWSGRWRSPSNIAVTTSHSDSRRPSGLIASPAKPRG